MQCQARLGIARPCKKKVRVFETYCDHCNYHNHLLCLLCVGNFMTTWTVICNVLVQVSLSLLIPSNMGTRK